MSLVPFDMDEDALMACADLVSRTGATGFKIGYLHDDVPIEQAGWYAQAQYRGARISVDDQMGPIEAADALSRRLLRGARCTHCHKPIALMSTRAGVCRWSRTGARWDRGCP